MNKFRLDKIKAAAKEMLDDPESVWSSWDAVSPKDAWDLVAEIERLERVCDSAWNRADNAITENMFSLSEAYGINLDLSSQLREQQAEIERLKGIREGHDMGMLVAKIDWLKGTDGEGHAIALLAEAALDLIREG